MSDELQIRTLAKNLYDELVGEIGRAATYFGAHRNELDHGTSGGIETGLRSANAALAKLAPNGILTTRLVSGTYSWASWKEEALRIRDAIQYHLANMGAAMPTWTRFWNEVVVQSGKEAAQGVQDITSVGAGLVPWVSAALIALVLGYLVFSFRRA